MTILARETIFKPYVDKATAKTTLGMAIIARDAESTIKQCIDSFKDYVDQIVVVLAGQSTDKTEEIVRSIAGVEVYSFDWIDDFAAARNFAFSKLLTDFYMWVDADDTVANPQCLRDLAAKLPDNFGCIWLPYHYGHDEFNNITTIFERERILRASCGWLWQSRIHETVSSVTPTELTRSNDAYVIHNHLAGKNRSDRNHKILNLMLTDEPENKRMWLYLGHQHFAEAKYPVALDWYMKFIQATDVVPIEKYQAMSYACKALRECEDYEKCIDLALVAIELHPQYKDAYLEIAHAYYGLGLYDKALEWINFSEDKQELPMLIFVNPLDYTFNKHCLKSDCLAKLNKTKEAIDEFHAAYKIRPTEEVKHRLELLGEILRRKEVSRAIKVISLDLVNSGELEKLSKVPEIAPYWFKDLQEYDTLTKGIKANCSLINPEMNKTYYSKSRSVTLQEHKDCPMGLPRFEFTLSRVAQLGEKLSILDIGCGDGTLAKQLKLMGHDVELIEPSLTNYELLKNDFTIHRCFFEDYTTDKHYDLIVALEVLEHVLDPKAFLEKCDKLSGRVIFTTPLPKIAIKSDNREHLRVLSQSSIEDLISTAPKRRVINLFQIDTGGYDNAIFAEYISGYEPAADSKLIRFYCGQGLEEWSPKTIRESGTGGAELGAHKLSHYLSQSNGNQVLLYAMNNEVWDSVIYRSWGKFNPTNKSHILISSRVPELMDANPQAKHSYLWLHDTSSWNRLTPDRAQKLTAIMALSHWHIHHLKYTYPFLREAPVVDLPRNKVLFIDDDLNKEKYYEEAKLYGLPYMAVLGNGIDTTRYNDLDLTKKLKHSFIWSSSPDRGLKELLELWPKIRSQWSDATLKIFYGFNTYFNSLLHIPEMAAMKQDILKLLSEQESHGVTWVGRISQDKLAAEMMATQYWLYPPHGFHETYCITALEAQAAGVICLYRSNGALGEVIADRGLPIAMDASHDQMLALLSGIDNDVARQRELINAGRLWAMQQDWSKVAGRIITLYNYIETHSNSHATKE